MGSKVQIVQLNEKKKKNYKLAENVIEYSQFILSAHSIPQVLLVPNSAVSTVRIRASGNVSFQYGSIHSCLQVLRSYLHMTT